MAEGPGRITVIGTGPYKIDPGAELRDASGEPIPTTEGEPFFLCRCGNSSNKPFCDGTHNRSEWDPTLASKDD